MTFSRQKRKEHLHLHHADPGSADASADASADVDEQNWKWFKRKVTGIFMTVVSLGLASFLSWFSYQFWQHGERLTTLEERVQNTQTDVHDLRVHFLGERKDKP